MMAESVNDVATVQRSLQRTLQSTEDELAAQARLTRDLQDDLLRTRMVEFESMSDRLYRVVRQAAKETGKQVRLDIVGGAIEIDRGVLDRMTGAFEHLLRNCVAHGIESPAARAAAGKDATGIDRHHAHPGGQRSRGRVPRRRRRPRTCRASATRAVRMGLIAAGAQPERRRTRQPDLHARLLHRRCGDRDWPAAASAWTWCAPRSTRWAAASRPPPRPASGTSFRLVLPLTTAVTQVVMLRCGELTGRRAVDAGGDRARASPQTELETAYATRRVPHRRPQRCRSSGSARCCRPARAASSGTRPQPVVVIRSAAQRIALHVDEVLGNQEVVVKNLGPQLARLPGLAGMTLLPSGAPALIYNPVALATLYGESAWAMTRAAIVSARRAAWPRGRPSRKRRWCWWSTIRSPCAASRSACCSARATASRWPRTAWRRSRSSAEERPAVLLSDIEMPRMDGFDLVRNLRADPTLADLPVIMITSRIAQKHRDYAAELGVDHYLGKPYAEEDLLSLVARYARASANA